jgi:chaperonin cofactor prefoldin
MATENPAKELAEAQKHLASYVIQLGRKRERLTQQLAEVERALAEIEPVARGFLEEPPT